MAKSTQVTYNQRVSEVVDLLLDGRTRSFILQYATNSNWGISDAQVDKYIGEANKQISEVNQGSIEESLALIMTNLLDLYRSHKKSSPDLARKIMMDIAKLRGLDQNTVLLKVEARDLESTSDADLLSLLTPKGPEDDT